MASRGKLYANPTILGGDEKAKSFIWERNVSTDIVLPV